MRLKLSILCALLLAAACSKSSVELLKAGDSSVCARSDVTDQLFTIIRQTAFAQNTDGTLRADSDIDKWVKAITLGVKNVTSRDVDVPNQKIKCNADVVMKPDMGGQQVRNVDYQVSNDLSTNVIIVSVDLSTIRGPFGALVDQVSAPDRRKNQETRIAADDKKSDGYLRQWKRENAAESAAREKGITWTDSFDVDEIKLILLATDLKYECIAARDSEETRLCVQRAERVRDQLHKANVCNPNDDVWVHCEESSVAPNRTTGGSSSSAVEPFSPEENALIEKEDQLNDKCRDGAGDQTELLCNQRDALFGKMKSRGICWGPDSAESEAEKRWIRCSQM